METLEPKIATVTGRIRRHAALATTAICLFAAGASHGAVISWSSQLYPVNGNVGQFLDTGVFDTSGSLVLAENLGGAALSFDGINFSAPTIDFGNSYNGYHSFTTAPLAATGTWASPPTTPQTVDFTGLTPGNDYRIQALIVDGRASFNGFYAEFDGQDQGVHGNGIFNVTWGEPLLVTGIFNADLATQSFDVQVFSPSNVANGGQLNAILLHDLGAPVPEPSSFALAGLCILGLVGYRRRARRTNA